MRVACLAAIFLATLAGDDSGTTPRSKPSDYPVHQTVKTAELAAVVLTPDQVKKIFSPEVAKAYTIVEVAVYPADSQKFDVDLLDYFLKIGDETTHADKPDDVMIPWGNPGSVPTAGNRGPAVTEDSGVIVAHGTDPATGRPRTAVGTWEDVGVSNYPRPADAPPAPRPDQTALYHRIAARALPQGETAKPVAGYLYFPQYGKKRKHDSVALNYSRDQVSIDLKFPK
jgi:hypothetical protein